MIERDGVLDFDAMQTRLHPAESRVNKLSAEIPARVHRLRRARLEGRGGLARSRSPSGARSSSGSAKRFQLSPATRDRDEALDWLDRFEAIGLDGVIAKRLDLPYLPGSRDGVVKVKPEKTADCVVVGVRWKSRPDRIATLLLGLYGEDGEIDYVGSAAVAPARHDEIAERVAPAARERARAPLLGAEPLGRRRARGVRRSAPSSSSRCATTRCSRTASATARSCIRFRDDKDPKQCTWRELLPPAPRRPGVDALLSS